MGSITSCYIRVDETGKSFYWTGETISGYVLLTVKRAIKIKSIDLNIIGELCCEHTMVNDMGTPTYTTTIRKQFYVKVYPVCIPSTYRVSNRADTYYLLDANNYELPFSVHLAEHLLPSLKYAVEPTPFIDYSMKVNMNHLSFRRNLCSTSTISITITPRVPRPTYNLSLKAEKSNSRGVLVYGKLLRHYLLIGEQDITLELNIQNPSQTAIEEIIIKITQRRHLDPKSASIIIFEQALPEIASFQGRHVQRTLQIPVNLPPLSIPPTVHAIRIRDNRSWTIDYVLEVILKSPIPSADITLEFPLFVVNSANQPQTTDVALDKIE